MDNEHTTITDRQASPPRPQQINSFSINDRSSLPLPSACVICCSSSDTSDRKGEEWGQTFSLEGSFEEILQAER